MTGTAELERRYRRWLRWYPRDFRREHEPEMLAVLVAGARDGQRRPEPMECLDLLGSALRMHARPRVPCSDRSALAAIRLMYAGAMVELATAIVVLASIGDVKSAIIARNPRFSDAQWHAEVGGRLAPTAVAALVAVGLWLWLAWANGRGHRWAHPVFVVFFAVNTYGLLDGLAHGSAMYAHADLAAGTVLCLVHLAAIALLVHTHIRTVLASRSGNDRIGAG